jgi:prophage maintenance system killer protein
MLPSVCNKNNTDLILKHNKNNNPNHTVNNNRPDIFDIAYLIDVAISNSHKLTT